jgi:tetratricopeptide (TPR) repeat protein/transcriptional regulator with XRE-family HTH domain
VSLFLKKPWFETFYREKATMGQTKNGMYPLRNERHRRNLTQRQLADLTGVSISTIQRAEQGKPIRNDCRCLLCACLDKSAQELGLVDNLLETKLIEHPSSPMPVSAQEDDPTLASGVITEMPLILAQHYQEIDVLGGFIENAALVSEQQIGAWMALTTSELATFLDVSAGWSVESLLQTIHMIMQGVKAMPKVTRRRLFQLGAAAVVSGIAVPLGNHVSAEERMQLCLALSESIASGWKLLYSVRNAQMLAVAQAHLFLVQQNHTLLYPQTRAYYYAGVYSQIGMSLHFQEREREALHAYQSAYIAALETGDPWYVAQNLICQADSYHAIGQYTTAIQTIEEAFRVIGTPNDESMTRARSHLLTCWADNAMMLAQDNVVQEKLARAEVYFDQLIPNEEFDQAGWLLLSGKYALKTANYVQAKRQFEEALRLLPDQWVLRRVMTGIGLAMALAHLREREESIAVATRLVPMLQTIDAPMTNRWFHEYLQQDLQATFATDEPVRRFVRETYAQLPQLMRLPVR